MLGVIFCFYYFRVRNAWFMVTLTEVSTIPWRIVEAFCQGRAMETRQIEIVRQCLDIVLKSSAMETMLAVGKSPRNFYFPLKKQEDVMKNDTLAMKMFRNPVRFCIVMNVCLVSESFSYQLMI
jgi:hypothetical protein